MSNINFHKIPSVNTNFGTRMDRHYVTMCLANARKLTVHFKMLGVGINREIFYFK